MHATHNPAAASSHPSHRRQRHKPEPHALTRMSDTCVGSTYTVLPSCSEAAGAGQPGGADARWNCVSRISPSSTASQQCALAWLCTRLTCPRFQQRTCVSVCDKCD